MATARRTYGRVFHVAPGNGTVQFVPESPARQWRWYLRHGGSVFERLPRPSLLADFNGDGKPDLATGNPALNGAVAPILFIFLGMATEPVQTPGSI